MKQQASGDPREPGAALAPAVHPATHPLRGIGLLLTALLFFSCLDATTKYLSALYDVPLVVAVRYIVNALLLVVILAPRQGMDLVRTQRTGLVLARAACLTLASLFMGLALQRMPVAETTAIVFLGPMLVVLIAGPLLKERIGWLGWTAALTGFAGVLLIARPGSALAAAGVGFALCTVLVNAGYQLLSRVLVRTERTGALLFHAALFGTICFGISLPWYAHGRVPTGTELLLFLSMGVTGGMGHFLLTAAYRHAPASVLAPVNYCQLLWAGLLGWLVFDHVPDHLTLLGMGIIALSGVMITLKRHRPAG